MYFKNASQHVQLRNYTEYNIKFSLLKTQLGRRKLIIGGAYASIHEDLGSIEKTLIVPNYAQPISLTILAEIDETSLLLNIEKLIILITPQGLTERNGSRWRLPRIDKRMHLKFQRKMMINEKETEEKESMLIC